MGSNDPLHMWFRSVDVDRSGSINASELKRALEAGNLHFPPSVINQMIKMYDNDLNGTMSFDEFVSLHKFLSLVQDTFSRHSRLGKFDLFDHVISEVEESLTLKALLVSTLCGLFPYRNRGFLTLKEMYPALQQTGYSLDQPSFFTVCQSFDLEKSGNFRLDNFMSVCIFLQSAKNLFSAFDTKRKGHVTLDFNQFVYCSANLRI